MSNALFGLLNVCNDILACYIDVIGTDLEPGWIEDLKNAMEQVEKEKTILCGGR
jgi:hypothetical protein